MMLELNSLAAYRRFYKPYLSQHVSKKLYGSAVSGAELWLHGAPNMVGFRFRKKTQTS